MLKHRDVKFNIQIAIIWCILLISIFTCYISQYPSIYGLISFATVVLIGLYLLFVGTVPKQRITIFWVLTIFPVLFNNYGLKIGEYGSTIRYIAILLYLLISTRITDQTFEIFFKVYRFVGGVFSTATILFYFFPALYYIITPLLIPSAERLFGLNIAAGLTYHYSYNTIIISVSGMMVFAEYLYKRECGLPNRKNIAYIGVAFAALAFTGKRSVPFFAVFSMLFAFYLYMADKKKARLYKFFGIFLALFASLYIISMTFPELFGLNRLFDSSGSINMSGRDKIYVLAISYFRTNVWLGIGWGHFRKLSNLAGVGVANIDVHNVFLNLLCEVGIVGFLLFIFAFASSFILSCLTFVKMRKRKIQFASMDTMYIGFSVSMQLFFLVYCFTGNPLYDAPVLYPYMISIGMLLRFLFGEKALIHSSRSRNNGGIWGYGKHL